MIEWKDISSPLLMKMPKSQLTVQCVCVCVPSYPTLQPLQPVRLLCPWDFSGKNTARGCPFPSPVDLPNPGIKSASPAVPAFQANSLGLSRQESHQQ